MTQPDNRRFTRLTARDTSRLKALLQVFGEAFDDVARYQSAVPTDTYLARLLARDHFIALVAEVDDAVVGGIAAYVLDKFEQDCREIYIYDLAVAESHRRRGLATGLIRELQTIAADLDVYVIFVQADLEDAPAIALYEKLGIKETAHHFDIDVPGRRTRA